MLRKATNHVIKAKIEKKRFRRLGVWIVAKKLHLHPKTPNPRCRTKEK